MTHNILRMATVIQNKVFGLSGEVRVEELIKTMYERKLINLYGENLENFNVNSIYRAICKMSWDSGFATSEVVVYLLKYYHGMKNNDIRDIYIDEYPLLYAVNFRNVEKLHMNISRRVFNQPEYTNQNITCLDQIMCNARLKSIIKELESNEVYTINDFQMFILKFQLKNGILSNTWQKYRHVIDALYEITDRKFSYCDSTQFPWNMIKSMNDVISVDTFINNFMFNENIDDVRFILSNEQILKKVVLFNLRMLLNEREFTIIKEKFVDGKSFTAIRDAHKGYPSPGRLQQVYSRITRIISRTTNAGELVTNGFRLVVENPDEPIIQALFENPPDQFFKVTTLIIPGSVHAMLPELYGYTKDNPLIYNVLMCGYEKGLIKTNQELRVEKTGETTLNVPSTIEDMNLPVRTYNALYRAGINDIATLSTLKYSQLVKIKNLGKKSIKGLLDKLALYGIFLQDYDYSLE